MTDGLRILGIFILNLVVWTVHARADESCRDQATPASAARAMEISKALAEYLLLAPDSSDHVVGRGTRITITCEKTAKLLQMAVLVADRELRNCHRWLGLPELENARDILARATVVCDYNFGFTAQNAFMYRDISGQLRLRDKRTGYLFRVDAVDDPVSPERILSIAMNLAHEALHSTAANNRTGHNRISPSDVADSCRESPYADRVYFLSAACFPGAEGHAGSHMLYGAQRFPEECGDVCEQALGWVDPELAATLPPQIVGPARSRKTVGPICSRIRKNAALERNWQRAKYRFEGWNSKLFSHYKTYPTGSIAAVYPDDAFAPLADRLFGLSRDLRTRIFEARLESRIDSAQELLKRERAEIEKWISDYCVPPGGRPGPTPMFCAQGYTDVNAYFSSAEEMVNALERALSAAWTH